VVYATIWRSQWIEQECDEEKILRGSNRLDKGYCSLYSHALMETAEFMDSHDVVWNHCSNSAVRRAARQLGQLYDKLLEPSGLRLTQFGLLTQIHFCKDASLKSLAELLVMDLSALGHTLKPLIRDGYVELVQDDKDRRVKRARLTPAGTAKMQEAMPMWQDAQDRFDRLFGKENSEKLREVLATASSPEFAMTFKENGDVT
jgi:DNA-binding MarR family transcriptional regulator